MKCKQRRPRHTARPESQPDTDETVDASKKHIGPNELEKGSNGSGLLPVPPGRDGLGFRFPLHAGETSSMCDEAIGAYFSRRGCFSATVDMVR